MAAEPANAAVLAGNEWNIHKIQGWAPDFIPSILDQNVIDELVPIDEDIGIKTTLKLATEEGIFAGISAGATLATALKIAENAPEGSVLLAMLPDTGERYLSTELFEKINEGSDDDWLASLEVDLNVA